ncbi:PDZ domain (Also known as DHR or GLGF) domain-containing protein [Ditylenchus destructor]|uniref:PDZ domain (Also known as DHR or GLGF) domain-containing protein n=1 Tax=Ditylenchus destructor TaxID=166010 RepID=A0AAD4N5L1_9BILA|nr:PDZ domain (Also known as DHR or GLGF) domain-containing protein [Ditylenchus destructor]
MPSWICMPFFACNRQVDSLDKRQCNLQTVPHDIDRYARTLEELLLDMNHIRDLPKSLFRVHKLRRLGLSDNDIHRLPPDIASLQNLVELNISRNDISDLPEELKSCRQLLILDVSSNPIARLPDSITQVFSLTHLSLNDTSLTRLPQDIGRLSALKSLEVRENHLRSLPQSITQLTNLLRLDLGQNELDELPAEIGALSNLQELYVDDNSLESLPESLLYCAHLEQLDVQSNRLMCLPLDLGELVSLADLTLSHNCLSILPNSIGRLKKLLTLRLDDNSLTQLTPAIGSCSSLTEFYLMQNLISELPSTIGNLKKLENLNVDKNQLTHIPPLIGDCSSLSLLSLRDNQLEELPLEIGKLSKLRVLDVCNNRLTFLPYTIGVLFNLQALWLSENQSQALLKLQNDVDPRTGIKVLTCYLLPQQNVNHNEIQSRTNRSFVGGPKVHFGDVSPEDAELDSNTVNSNAFGNFERHDTPHPKPHIAGATKHKKVIDGHIIHKMEEHQPTTLALTKKISTDQTSASSFNEPHHPKSALKHSSVHIHMQNDDAMSAEATTNQNIKERNVGFALAGCDSDEGPSGCRLKRINTPHYAKGYKLGGSTNIGTAPARTTQNSTNSTHQQPKSEGMLQPSDAKATTSSNTLGTSNNTERLTKRVVVRREPNHGLGLSIAGGIESTPYVEGDSGLFISKLIPKGPAERCGLRVGDKVLEINGKSMVGERHDTAVQCIQQKPDIVNLVTERILLNNPKEVSPTTTFMHPTQAEASHTNHTQLNQSAPSESIKDTNETVIRPKTPTNDQKISVSNTNQNGRSRIEIADLPYGDTSFDGMIEEVPLTRDSKNSLGLSIVGGIDHCSHPFGTDSAGVFISKITTNSPAAKSRRLRVGDRILTVNGKDVSKARHNEAVEALKNSGQTLRISVKHEPQPKGLKEATFKRRKGEPLGFSICGGINSPPANPADSTDEGIFIEYVEKGGCAEQCQQVQVGQRILEVNDDSLLGCTKDEAAQLLRKAPITVRLLVCDGVQKEVFEQKEFRADASTSSATMGPISRSSLSSLHSSSLADHFNHSINASSNALSNNNGPPSAIFNNGNKPLATSSPIPPVSTQPPALPPKKSALQNAVVNEIRQRQENVSKNPSDVTRFSTSLPSNKIAPPTAPKPKSTLITNGNNSVTIAPTINTSSNSYIGSNDFTGPQKEDERNTSYVSMPPPIANKRLNDNNSSSILSNSMSPITTFITQQQSATAEPQRNHPMRHSREWRQARLASLDTELNRADELLNCVREMSRLGNTSEERSQTTVSLAGPGLTTNNVHQKSDDAHRDVKERIIPIQIGTSSGPTTTIAVGGRDDIQFADDDK